MHLRGLLTATILVGAIAACRSPATPTALVGAPLPVFPMKLVPLKNEMFGTQGRPTFELHADGTLIDPDGRGGARFARQGIVTDDGHVLVAVAADGTITFPEKREPLRAHFDSNDAIVFDGMPGAPVIHADDDGVVTLRNAQWRIVPFSPEVRRTGEALVLLLVLAMVGLAQM
jgi:hypothetical protein